jgi:polar amino acid transport system substrate-binding protein
VKRASLTIVSAMAAAAVLAGCGGSSSGTKSDAAAQPAGSGSKAFDQKLFDQLPKDIQESKTISFGALWETPPAISVDPKDTKKPIGITPDLAAAVSEILGVTPEWQNMQWPAQLPGLQAGNVDVLWGQVSDSKEREESVADIIAWSQSPLALLVASGNPQKIGKLGDACGLKVAVPIGSQQSAAVEGVSGTACKGKEPIKAVEYPGAQQAIVALKAGSVDAWFDTGSSIREAADAGGFDVVPLEQDEIGAYMQTISGVAIAKAQPGLTEAIHGALQKLAESGEYQDILEKWKVADNALPVEEIKINGFTGIKAGEQA